MMITTLLNVSSRATGPAPTQSASRSEGAGEGESLFAAHFRQVGETTADRAATLAEQEQLQNEAGDEGLMPQALPDEAASELVMQVLASLGEHRALTANLGTGQGAAAGGEELMPQALPDEAASELVMQVLASLGEHRALTANLGAGQGAAAGGEGSRPLMPQELLTGNDPRLPAAAAWREARLEAATGHPASRAEPPDVLKLSEAIAVKPAASPAAPIAPLLVAALPGRPGADSDGVIPGAGVTDSLLRGGMTSLGSAAPGAPAASLGAPLASPEWGAQLGQRLVQMAQHGSQRIELNLHPADLGPLAISLKVAEQGAQAHFVAANAQVRQAIEQALPQLREALAEQGIELGETSVGEQGNTPGGFLSDGRSPAGSQGGHADSDARTVPDPQPQQITAHMLEGRVDLYA